jgi:hypothetical protein
MFSRLRKLAKPRAKKKEVILTLKLNFEVYNDNEDEAKADCKRFKEWVKSQFSEWDNSILQYFLYAYKLVQDPEDDKYLLDIHIDKIIKDDSSTAAEIKEFMDNIEKQHKDEEEVLDDKREEIIEEIENESEEPSED